MARLSSPDQLAGLPRNVHEMIGPLFPVRGGTPLGWPAGEVSGPPDVA